MSDVFEARPELDEWRARLWPLIEATPALDWLILTKRPEHVGNCVPWQDKWPANVWLGTTTENQRWANKRVPALLQYPAAVRFVSCEPLLGPLDLAPYLSASMSGVNWVIAGGESGHKARPMHPEWARSLRNQCEQAGVPFHFKQWGHWRPDEFGAGEAGQRIRLKGQNGVPITLVRLGKHAAGRDLDGVTWDGYPQ